VTRPLGVDDVLRLRSAADPRISPDGRLVAFVRSEPDPGRDRDAAHIWVVPAAGGEPRRWTAGERGDGVPRWSPDGRRLAFLSARGDGPARQVWVLDAAGGEARRLTDMAGGVIELAWSPAGDAIACVALVRPPSASEADRARPVATRRLGFKADGMGVIADISAHVFVVPLDGGAPRQLTGGDSRASGLAWSPDGTEIAYTAATHPERDLDRAIHLFAVAVAGGVEPRRITGGPGMASAPAWTADGRLVFAGRAEATDLLTGLFVVDATGGEAAPLLPGLDRTIMVGGPAYPGALPQVTAPDEVTFCARIGGCVHVLRARLDGSQVEPLIAGEREVSGFSAAGGAIAFVAADAGGPADVFLRAPDGSQRRLTDLNRDLLAEAPPVRPERRVFVSPDGVEIDAYVFRPAGGAPAPLLLDVHGGPHNAFGPALSGAYLYRQELVGRGWCVVAPNPRGSDGYGLRFLEGVRSGWGRLDQPDFMTVIDALVADGTADPGRVAVTGYSYGGFTTSWLVSQTDRFRSAVAGGLVCDLSGLYGQSDLGTSMVAAELGAEPFESWAPYDELSPLRHAARITTPLLILHGEADERCPIGQAESLFALLRRRRREVELVRYPGASHLFPLNGRLSHRRDFQRRLVDWVTAHDAAPA
jgi:dipeptidyl aminopeptidase/acylaminoacyl peptidase